MRPVIIFLIGSSVLLMVDAALPMTGSVNTPIILLLGTLLLWRAA